MRVLVVAEDLMARVRIEAAGQAAGHAVQGLSAVPDVPGHPTDLLIVDLDTDGALDLVAAFREAHPNAAIAGFAFHVNTERIAAARSLGVRVLAHGADPSGFF